MIEFVHLTNFRQHKDLSLTFNEGITVIKGSNEAGKTTVFEAISYALFGVKAARNNDLTSWGEAPNSHAVHLRFKSGAKTLDLKRSPKGAELTSEGLRVTGQTEVSKYCEELFGIPSGSGGLLMFSGQNTIRGTLESGGSQSARFIESLAGFDQIETWINTLQEAFQTGRTNMAEQSVELSRNRLEQYRRDLLQIKDPEEEFQRIESEVNDKVSSLETKVQGLKTLVGNLEPSVQELEKDEVQMRQVKSELDTYLIRHAVAEKDSNQVIEFVSQEILQHDEEAYRKAVAQLDIWLDYSSGSYYQPSQYMPADEFDRLMQEYQGQINESTEQIATAKVELQHQQGHLNGSTFCSSCKRPWDNAEQIVERQKQAKLEVERLSTLISSLETKVQGLRSKVQELQAFDKVSLPRLKDHSLWSIDYGFKPAKLTWTGEIPVEITQRQVSELERKWLNGQETNRKAEELRSKRDDALATVSELKTKVSSLTSLYQHLETKVQGLKVLGKQLTDCQASLLVTQKELETWKVKQEDLPNVRNQLNEPVVRLRAYIQEVEQSLEKQEMDLVDMKLNNALLKALRTIKPQVSAKVWKTLCGTVSHYFSLMRGSQSVVTHSDGSFKVDGNEVGSLSGSTLDVLGLSLRVALTKSFVPSCRFLLLDEPFAACDSERQAQALGFVTGAGFHQVIIITHEEATEAVADNLVTL